MILRSDEFTTQADSNRILKERVFPPRGLILDRNEEVVVENFIRQDLKVTPSFIEDYSLYISLCFINDLNQQQIKRDQTFSIFHSHKKSHRRANCKT